MRILFAAAPLLALAACEAAEDSARDGFRTESIAACTESSRRAAPAPMAGFDWERLCTCATDRIMEGKSAGELLRLQPGGPGQREAIEACFAEIAGEAR